MMIPGSADAQPYSPDDPPGRSRIALPLERYRLRRAVDRESEHLCALMLGCLGALGSARRAVVVLADLG